MLRFAQYSFIAVVSLQPYLWSQPAFAAEPKVRAKSASQPAQSLPPQATQILKSLDHLLSLDRLQFYSQSLADFLDGKKSVDLVTAIRELKAEDFDAMKFDTTVLKDPSQWQQIIYKTITQKKPGSSYNVADLAWGYNFFKNKLLEGFTVTTPTKSPERGLLMNASVASSRTSELSSAKESRVLLDVDRYVAEKTTRAVHWEAILSKRGFDFYVGTPADFLEITGRNGIQVIAEINPMARNYNKLYLTYDPNLKSYRYAFTLISGSDRIAHLSEQLGLLRYQNRSYDNKNSIRVFGDIKSVHQQQEENLLKVFQSLPVADKVIIGQKGAIENAIADAGHLDALRGNTARTSEAMKLNPANAARLASMVELAQKESAFQLEAMESSAIKIDKVYAALNDGVERTYRQFESQQPSHDFADYLLQRKDGSVVRWRVISAVWGDEIAPIARALRGSGHKDVVYIGTAGAIAGKGIEVGQVVKGAAVNTHSGKQLNFASAKVWPELRGVVVGQVQTPFQETEAWLKKIQNSIDVVEVETGYLREGLGKDVRLETYFLVSDIVGSETESLAHAAEGSSKRKRGQVRLLENLFLKENIRAPIPSFLPMSKSPEVSTILERLRKLKPSEDIVSLLQVAQTVLKTEGANVTAISDATLEKHLKAQPNFERRDWDFAIRSLGALLAELQSKLPKSVRVGVVSTEIFNGTFNPRTRHAVTLVSSDSRSGPDLMNLIGETIWQNATKVLSRSFDLRLGSSSQSELKNAHYLFAENAESFGRLLEKEVLFPAGFIEEVDASGRFEVKPIPGLGGRGLLCNDLF